VSARGCGAGQDQGEHPGGCGADKGESRFDPAADRVGVLDVVAGYPGLVNLTRAHDDLRFGRSEACRPKSPDKQMLS
jgi:hypothetical protein